MCILNVKVQTKTLHSQTLSRNWSLKFVYVLFLQLRAFSELEFKDGKPMVGTFRPVQPLNGRQVYRSGGAVILASSALLMAAIATALGLSHPN